MKVLHVRYGDPDAPARFVQSLRETGFAVLANHPIPYSLVEQSYAEWARYFASEEKHKDLFAKETQAGYFPFRSETAKGYKVSDLKEFYHYYPSRKALPSIATDATPQLYERLIRLGAELLQWIEDGTPAGVKAKFSMPLSKMIDGSEETLLRPIHYPPLKGGEEAGAIRAAEHEDINLITLLPAATAPGLQVRDLQGNWHEVSCSPGEIAINAGDMLQEASGGYYVSTTHRVVNPSDPVAARQPRFSMPLFVHPEAAVKLSDRYTARGYLMERLGQIGLV